MDSLIVSPLLQVVFDKLASLIPGELQTHRNFKKEIKKLQDKLPVIQAVIEEAEDRQHEDKKIRIWLTELKEVAYDADDLLDEISTRVLRKQSKRAVPVNLLPLKDHVVDELQAHYLKTSSNLKEIQQHIKNQVWPTCLTFEYFRLVRKLRDIRDRLDDIASEMNSFQLKEVAVCRQTDIRERRQTGPHVDNSEIYGRKEDVEKVVEILSSNNDAWVIPITGIGGIGKTTLAQLVYNDERVTRHFSLKIWISVYDDFNPRKITIEMLDYATKCKCDSTLQLGLLQSQLRGALGGKRFLLVLDDVWNDDPDEWDKVRNLLGAGVAGSKVIVTTRSQRVASIMSNTPPYHLEGLTKDDSWALFKQRAFRDREEDDFPYLLSTGKQIVDKCKGVPLATKVLGSLLRFRREESEWLRVQGNELWNLDGGENRILSVLKLSFNHLPSHLKRCFAYCAVFPKNYEINKEKLIRQWIAEGLIQISSNAYPDYLEPTFEDIGHDYFNDLLSMSFLEEASRCNDSGMTWFKMHDLIHDLAKYVAGHEFINVGKPGRQRSMTPRTHSVSLVCDGFAKTRHALVDCNFRSGLIPEPLYGAKKLRTLNVLCVNDASEKAIRSLFSGFKYLRTLNLSGLGIRKLHKSIGDLICLRYLDLSNTPIDKLPETICHLYKLQTLDLSDCISLLELPKKLREMIDLRHLDIEGCARLTHLPAFIGKLGNLQTLPIFIVGQTVEDDLTQLMHLHDLRGELKIIHLENVTRSHLSHMEMINAYYPSLLTRMECMQLHSLKLSWGDVDEGKLNRYRLGQPRQAGHSHAADVGGTVISLLQPNYSIKRLSVNGYPGNLFPDWMNSITTLSNLRYLELINCTRCESLPTLGGLPVLKVLHICGMDSVLNIGCEFFGEGRTLFPSLHELTMRDFPKLKTWESMNPMETFTCLNRLTIINCPFLITMPWFPSLRHLEMRKCNSVMLRCVAKQQSLFNLVIDNFPELLFIPKALFENNSLLLSLTILSCPNLHAMPENFGKLRDLKSLKIGWCQELDTLPHGFTNLTSLEILEIIECPSLVSLPEEILEGMSSLRSLSIENCHSLTSLPSGIKQARSLERLTIMYCSNLASLPEDLQHLSALKSLTILSCAELAYLPEGLKFITALETLEIHGCPKLMELPAWVENLVSLRSLTISDCYNIKSLPGGIQRLFALQHLSIRDCPELEKRCEMGNGADWQKISHTPHIYIGSSALQHGHNTASSSSA